MQMNLYEDQPDLNIENIKIYARKIKNDRKIQTNRDHYQKTLSMNYMQAYMYLIFAIWLSTCKE